MPAAEPIDAAAFSLSGAELGLLARFTTPGPLLHYAVPELDAAGEQEVLSGLVARGILRIDGEALLPAGDEAAVLAVVLTADEAISLTRYADEVTRLAFLSYGDALVAHTTSEGLEWFAPVRPDDAKALIAAFTGLAPDGSDDPGGGALATVDATAWQAAQTAPDAAAAAEHLPGLEPLAHLLFDAASVLGIDRISRTPDDEVLTLFVTVYESAGGADAWIVEGPAGAEQLSVRRTTPAGAGIRLAELLR
ncbi:MAG: hypothetical protein PGN13_08855 [Patulibacter minatonensis]